MKLLAHRLCGVIPLAQTAQRPSCDKPEMNDDILSPFDHPAVTYKKVGAASDGDASPPTAAICCSPKRSTD